jgi:hypothetical protein
MHGTFRNHRDGMRVRFDVPASAPPASRRWRAKAAALFAGCCVAALPIASLPTPEQEAQRQPPVRLKRAADLVAMNVVRESPARPIAPPALHRPIPLASAIPPLPAPAVVASAPLPAPSRLPTPVAIEPVITPDIPRLAVAPLPMPPLAVSLPDPATPLAVAEPPPALLPAAESPPPVAAPRKVDVVQIAESEVHPPRVPQLHEPGIAAGGGETLTTKIAAMQVAPPPPVRLRDSDRARLLAEAPTNMILRIGNAAVGKVDFRMTDTHGIDVRLSGLLDLLAGHYDAAEFARLRGSAAADAYVSFDQLRALGLNVRYDPVYDELRING